MIIIFIKIFILDLFIRFMFIKPSLLDKIYSRMQLNIFVIRFKVSDENDGKINHNCPASKKKHTMGLKGNFSHLVFTIIYFFNCKVNRNNSSFRLMIDQFIRNFVISIRYLGAFLLYYSIIFVSCIQ